jgi:hypothetical protein
VEGGFLRVGNASFPIGCEFQGGALIPTGSTTQSATGLFGYATIEGAPEYRLIWYTVPGTWFAHGSGERRYLIIRADDPLFSGTPNVQTGDGFEDYLGQVLETEHDMGFGAGGFVTGAAAAAFAQLYACPGTGGLTCASAALTAVVGIVGGGFATLLNLSYWVRQVGNVAAQFHTIALECSLPMNPLP